MFRMPVSGIEVEMRHATGLEDLLLLEGRRDLVSTSMELVQRLAVPREGVALEAAELTVTDVEALLLELRRRMFGDTVASRGRCPMPDCATPIDISFRIGDYLRGHDVRKLSSVEPLNSEPKWFQLRGSEIQFRLVTAGDLTASAESARPERELARRTIRTRSGAAWNHGQKRVERAMALLAPSLSGEIEGECPGCGGRMRFWFDVQSYVQQELRYDAEFLYDDVHQLATQYHWSEEKILSLPRQRRLQYVEMALRQGGGG